MHCASGGACFAIALTALAGSIESNGRSHMGHGRSTVHHVAACYTGTLLGFKGRTLRLHPSLVQIKMRRT